VAYVEAGDLWLFEVASNERRQLTSDGDATAEWSPAFAAPGCVVLATARIGSDAAIELLELAPGGSRQVVVEETGAIRSLAVHPRTSEIAYLHIDYDLDSTFRLKRLVIGGQAATAHAFAMNLGRGGSSEDEVSVAWSPDGARLLVANTHEFTSEFAMGSIYVFDATGSEVLARWPGTHPRWSPDGQAVYFRGHAGDEDSDSGWQLMDLATMVAVRLDMRTGSNGAAVSPDGRYVAYDTSSFGDLPTRAVVTGMPPNVYLFDLRAGQERLLLRGAMAPIWISPDGMLVTDMSLGAPKPDVWGGQVWDPLGTVTELSIDGDAAPVAMTSTLNEPAVLLPN
jgi:hypothetical protein